MIGLLIAIILFNYFAFKKNKRLTANQIVHIWTFTISFQVLFDLIIEFKYHGYWYFSKGIDWEGLLPHIFLVPAANMIFLNWFPHNSKVSKQIIHIILFVIVILIYEALTLLPAPWGYFHYGWWKLWHAAVINPVLLFILLRYYKWICNLEKKACRLL